MRKGLPLLLVFLLLSACTNAEVPVEEKPAPQEIVEATKEKQETITAQWARNVPSVTFKMDWSVDGSAEETILELTHPKYQGRVTGSQGNRLAADWIETQFSDMGLQPIPSLDSYRHTYEDECFEVLPGDAAIVHPDGTETELELGVDWVFKPSAKELELTLPLSDDLALCEAGEAILDGEKTTQKSPKKAVEIFVGDVSGGFGYFNERYEASRIMVTEAVYEQLSTEGAKLHLSLPKAAFDGDVDNIVGYLPGEDNNKLVVFAAHFDGSGQCGTLLPGAYSNASGVSVLMQTARWISKGDKLPCDVVFVAFNGSENGMDGSAEFSRILDDHYKQILVINMKCVGWTGEALTLYSDTSEAFLNELAGALEIQYIADSFLGDQTCFRGERMQALTISQEAVLTKNEIGLVPGKTYDTVDNLDATMLDELSYKLAAWFLERGGDLVAETIPVVW